MPEADARLATALGAVAELTSAVEQAQAALAPQPKPAPAPAGAARGAGSAPASPTIADLRAAGWGEADATDLVTSAAAPLDLGTLGAWKAALVEALDAAGVPPARAAALWTRGWRELAGIGPEVPVERRTVRDLARALLIRGEAATEVPNDLPF